VTNEELDGTDVVLDLLGESQRVADETRQALPQGAVEALNVIPMRKSVSLLSAHKTSVF
jgi:hypothetical protein